MIPNSLKIIMASFWSSLSLWGITIFQNGKFLNIQIEENSVGYWAINVLLLLSLLYGIYKIYTVIRKYFLKYQMENYHKIINKK